MAGKPVKVLLVEDDEGDYVLTRSLLAEVDGFSFEVVRADRLQEAIDLVDDAVQAVLLDLSLPDSRGWETFERMYAHAPHVPIILLSGLADETLAVRAVQSGAQDYLVKGHIDSHLLGRSICYAIERKKTKDDLEHVAAQLRFKNAEMADDLNMARDVQMALLPRAYPRFRCAAQPTEDCIRFAHLYRPCAVVGGDFFNILKLSDTAAGVLVCDVMGHGMRAALITAIVRGLVEELRGVAQDPGSFLSAVNDALLSILNLPDQLIFVTAAYAVLDVATGSLCYAVAGHPPPLIVNAGGGEPVCPDAALNAAPAMGLEPGYAYASLCRRVASGDRIAFFTDGLADVESGSGEPYGGERIGDVLFRHAGLPLEHIVSKVTADIESFSGDTTFEDDLCVVIVEAAHVGAPV